MENEYTKYPCHACGGKKGFDVLRKPEPFYNKDKNYVWVACGTCKGYGYRLEKKKEKEHQFIDLDLNSDTHCPFSDREGDSVSHGCNLVRLDLAYPSSEHSCDCYGEADAPYVPDCYGDLNEPPLWCPLGSSSTYTFSFHKKEGENKE